MSNDRSSINPINSPGVQGKRESDSSTAPSAGRTTPASSSSSSGVPFPVSGGSSAPKPSWFQRNLPSFFPAKTKAKSDPTKPISIEKATLVIETCIELLQKNWLDNADKHKYVEGLFRESGSVDLADDLFAFIKKSDDLTSETLKGVLTNAHPP